MTPPIGAHALSMTRGGPFYHLLQRLHLTSRDGAIQWWPLSAIAWLPLLGASLLHLAIDGRVDPIVKDLSAHARYLLAVPLVVAAENLLEYRCAGVAERFRADLADWVVVDQIVDRAHRMRDSVVVEVVITVLAVIGGLAALWTGETGFVHGGELTPHLSFATVWYGTVALPLLQFLLLRWLWRWVIWTYVLVRISREPLRLNAINPDKCAGLHFVGGPIDALALFGASQTVIASAAWATQILNHQAKLSNFVSTFFTFELAISCVAFGPLVAFTGKLYAARTRDLACFHGLVTEYVDRFRAKWLGPHADEVLGTADIQSLNDLGSSFETGTKTRMVPITTRPVINLWLCTVIPVVPLVFTEVPVRDVAKQLGHALLGLPL
jgi:hypothetical protein